MEKLTEVSGNQALVGTLKFFREQHPVAVIGIKLDNEKMMDPKDPTRHVLRYVTLTKSATKVASEEFGEEWFLGDRIQITVETKGRLLEDLLEEGAGAGQGRLIGTAITVIG